MTPFHLLTYLTMMLLSAGKGNGHHDGCPEWFDCGNLGRFGYPFTKVEHKECGLWPIRGCNDHNPNSSQGVLLNIGTISFKVTKFEFNWFTTTLYHVDENLTNLLQSDDCTSFSYHIKLPPSSPLGYFYISNNITLFKCNHTLNVSPPKTFFKNTTCPDDDILFGPPKYDYSSQSSLAAACTVVQLPMNGFEISANPFAFLTAEIPIEFHISDECFLCKFHDEGRCLLNSEGKFYCPKRKHKSLASKQTLILGIGLSIIILFWLIHILRHCKRKFGGAHTQLQSRNIADDPDTETNRIFFGVPVFSYKELQEATNNFEHTRKLGEGGFGSVYYGKLTDGREVAVKHLFEHNYRRVEQFMNEIEILTRLRHGNLVSLYGCTSRHSRELLLVYEYVPNGTVASHLHGDFGRANLLTWPVRMQIAVETAAALAYLHASDIIHRDVKTNNILLDFNFSVKVADFGLSRLFPNDVSHVSTAPQGSPGYLDPEYFQCYQLTNKSDVYSFGVVLMELISSMPAVDATRGKDEINLANLAIKRIQKGSLGEMVDPSLGFESDHEVKRMVTLVAELAFRCVQGDRELRPSMDQVLQALNKIESGTYEAEHLDKGDEGAGIEHNEEARFFTAHWIEIKSDF